MNPLAIAQSASEALHLLAAFPFQWLLVFTVFLVAVEGLMLIPYVGFTLKLSLAGLLTAQLLVLFAGASSGHAPQLQDLLGVFYLPWTSKWVLIGSALLPFLAGLAYLVFRGKGFSSTAFFLGNIFKTKPPPRDVFSAFKNVMYVFSIPLTFIAAAITLRSLSGWTAVAQGLHAGLQNWLALLVILILCMAFEWIVGKLPIVLPRAVGAVLSMVLLVVFLAWSSAFTYTLAVSAFGLGHSTAM
jgi:hypothetical protein